MGNQSLAYKILTENYIDENGCSEVLWIPDLIEKYGADIFASTNGCDWARKNSSLGKKFVIKLTNAKEAGVHKELNISWNKNVMIQFLGFNKETVNHSIPSAVKTALKNKPCAVLGVTAELMEIDHKNGKYDQEQYEISDFQPLSKAVNDAKREHCKRCNETKCRFKASILGYNVDFIEGNENSPTCQGCYWYDPQLFNRTISANFKK